MNKKRASGIARFLNVAMLGLRCVALPEYRKDLKAWIITVAAISPAKKTSHVRKS